MVQESQSEPGLFAAAIKKADQVSRWEAGEQPKPPAQDVIGQLIRQQGRFGVPEGLQQPGPEESGDPAGDGTGD